jgi:hypothetical protein
MTLAARKLMSFISNRHLSGARPYAGAATHKTSAALTKPERRQRRRACFLRRKRGDNGTRESFAAVGNRFDAMFRRSKTGAALEGINRNLVPFFR